MEAIDERLYAVRSAQALARLASALNRVQDRPAVGDLLCREAAQGIGATGAAFLKHYESTRTLQMEASACFPEEIASMWQAVPVSVFEELAQKHGEAFVLPDLTENEDMTLSSPNYRHCGVAGLKSLAVAAIRREADLYGVLMALSTEERTWRTEDLFLLQAMADQAAQAFGAARLQEQLWRSQKLEALGTLAGGIAHDFNNILTAISGYAELLEGDVDEASREDVQEIKQAAARAAALTSQLLAFSRKQVARPTLVELPRILKGLESMLRRLIGEQIELQIHVGETTPRIWADPGHLEQVILNLVVNARDALPEGGNVWITADGVTESSPDHGEKRWARVSVRDNGLGMDPETRAKIFDPFFTTKALGEGTGLGLSTVYGIIKQAEGRIEVSSEPGKGSAFTLLLPEGGGDACTLHLQYDDNAGEPAGRGETILVVEDEAAVRLLIARVLRRLNYLVLEAANSAEALDIFSENSDTISLLLTDLVMPGEGGVTLANVLRAIQPRLKILFMTGYASREASRAGIGAEQVLIKPFDNKTLARAVGQALQREQAKA